MFNLKANNTTLDLPEDFSIPFFLFNPVFSEVQSFTLGFELELTDNNLAALQFPDDPHFVFTNYKIPAKLCIFDETLYNGTLTLEGTADTSINAFLSIGQGNFWENASNTKLSEIFNDNDIITMGADTDDVIDYINDIVEKELADLDINSVPVSCNFPMVKDGVFYENANAAFQGYINWWDFGGEAIQKNDIINTGLDNINAIVPFFYLNYIYKKIAAYFNLKTSGQFFTTAYFKKILLLNNYDLSRKERKYVSRASSVTQLTFYVDLVGYLGHVIFDDKTTPPNEDIDNCFTIAGATYYTVQHRGFHSFLFSGFFTMGDTQTHYISVRVVDHEDNSQLAIGYFNIQPGTTQQLFTFQGRVYLDDSYLSHRIGFDCYSENHPYGWHLYCHNRYCIVTNESILNLNVFALDINPSKHMPDINISDFIKNTSQYLGIAAFVNDFNETFHICRLEDIYKDPEIIDISHLVDGNPTVDKLFKNKILFKANYESKDISIYNFIGIFDSYSDLPYIIISNAFALVKNTGKYYYSFFDPTLLKYVWAYIDDNIADVLFGDNNDELLNILPEVAPVKMDMYNNSIHIPSSEIPATSPDFGTGKKDFDLELMQYHGMLEGPYTGKYFPAASRLRWDKDCNDITGFDLTPEFLAENHMKQHFNQLAKSNRILSFPANPSYQDIKQLKMWKRHRINNIVGLIVSINGDFQSDTPGPCTLKFLPL